MTSEFVISLDFELLWGVRDHADKPSYGPNILGARDAIPRMLDLFSKYDVAASWATVGFLFCESYDELIDCLPDTPLCPSYDNPTLSNYNYLSEVGANETVDPYYFAPSLIRQIADTPRQEIATHTLSHYYCLEDGATDRAFEADLKAAIAIAQKRGIQMRSIVFPRNQYGPSHLEICSRHGINTYRGNRRAWAYRPTKGAGQTPLRRALRLLDAHTGVLGAASYAPEIGTNRNVPASQFLRPRAGRLAHIHPAHIRTIKAGMTRASQNNAGYHLWWHPHNFGRNMKDNLTGLEQVLQHFKRLHEKTGMVSQTMGAET